MTRGKGQTTEGQDTTYGSHRIGPLESSSFGLTEMEDRKMYQNEQTMSVQDGKIRDGTELSIEINTHLNYYANAFVMFERTICGKYSIWHMHINF